jgi:hypothetical protein
MAMMILMVIVIIVDVGHRRPLRCPMFVFAARLSDGTRRCEGGKATQRDGGEK